MKKLRAVLSPYVDSVQLGDPERDPIDVERLREQLQRVSRESANYFGVCVVMVMVIFLATLGAALRYAGQANLVTLAFAVLGATMIGMLRVMVGLWREKVATDVLLALAGSLEGDHLRSILAVFLKRLR
jgi:hypothetical protein